MSMEDILKVLIESRQQGNTKPSQQAADPMSNLIGSLLGGAQAPSQPASQPSGQGGLGDMMGMLEMFMGSGQGTSSAAAANTGDPIMMLLRPIVDQLAKKLNIPTEIAMMVASFAAHKLLAHHPTSGRDSNTFDLEDMMQQMGTGQIDNGLMQKSGMVKEISSKTGMDEAASAQALNAAFTLLGQQLASGK